MNLLTKIIMITAFASCGYFAFAQNCNAKVSIKTDIENTKLFIDDIYVGEGNNFITELETGKHVIHIENLWIWNSKLIIDTINILNCDDVNLNYVFNNKKILDTNPQDVYVFKGDSIIGFTPLLIEQGQGEYLLQKPDYSDKIIYLEEISSAEKPKLEFVGIEKGESFYNTTLFKVLVGTALTLGATTAYYKLEADKKFDEYQITGNTDLLNQTERYDVISGITFAALQINFGVILYLFLTD